MFIDDFVWLPGIIDKLYVKHRVLENEVEEVFFIFFIYEADKTALILSARDMDVAERRRYERK